MTHASFSEENNRALSILGTSIIETFVSFRYLLNDMDIYSKTLNRVIAEACNVESSCPVDGMRLGLHKIVRVSHNTNCTTPAIVCGAFRAIFSVVALDSGKSDDASKVSWNVHTRTVCLQVGGEPGNRPFTIRKVQYSITAQCCKLAELNSFKLNKSSSD
ncbi:protein NUCLEAR FUSION DEFECTIVE 2-like [Chenopodium quinoa]|uniref:protein NUCLEAR FUSION DEFECTIVE 2-like n=1 Tax=Chenopodium quinoa TaxID=63459 RepID=UPI000B77210F|nr:protein NUCLEAR FUSION DEFECTIVE 2-like [Chenopodium quinoa]